MMDRCVWCEMGVPYIPDVVEPFCELCEFNIVNRICLMSDCSRSVEEDDALEVHYICHHCEDKYENCDITLKERM